MKTYEVAFKHYPKEKLIKMYFTDNTFDSVYDRFKKFLPNTIIKSIKQLK